MARDTSQRSNRQASQTNQRSGAEPKTSPRTPQRAGGASSASGAAADTASSSRTAASSGVSQKSGTENSPAASRDRGDRERQIATGTEAGRSSGGSSVAPRRGFDMDLGDPFSLLQRMSEDMDRLFEQFGLGGMGLTPRRNAGSSFARGTGQQGLARGGRGIWSPQVEVFQRGQEVVVRADLPGMTRDDIRVEVEGDVLTIAGERKQENEENREGFFRSERSYGQFYRALPLPENVEPSAINASFNDGVLEVTIPTSKEPERRSTRIEVR